MATVRYQVDLAPRHHNRVHVRLTLDPSALPDLADGVGGSGTVDVEWFLPVWTPGSYLVREYSKHLEGMRATTASGTELEWRKTRKNRFAVLGVPTAEELVVEYTVFGHELTVRTSDFVANRVYWNGACVFLWPVAALGTNAKVDASIDVELPSGWRIVSQLATTDQGDRVELYAPDHDALVDAPVIAGADLDCREIDVGGKPHGFVLDGMGGIEPPPHWLDDCRKVIETAGAIFNGDLPYSRYDFLCLFTDQGYGGLEHTASTTLLAARTTFAPKKDYEQFMGLIAHEFFHVWNVKRMRPEGLWSFDYERENYTELLWVAEGFTAYYDDLICRRAAVLGVERYLEIVGENIQNTWRTPGRLLHPLAGASYDAWIKLYRPDENTRNSTQSYYANGGLAAMCIDLAIRDATDGERSLDDVVRHLYASTYDQNRGYTHQDVLDSIAQVADRDFGAEINALVRGPFDPDFETTLATVGIAVERRSSSGPYLGVHLRSGSMVLASVSTGGPAAEAGLMPGDELIAVEGIRMNTSGWSQLLRQLWIPDAPLRLLLARRGEIQERVIHPTVRPRDTCKLVIQDDAGERATKLRNQWLAVATDED